VLTVVGPIGGEDHHAGRHRQAGHPERPSRIDAVMDGIADLHLDSDLRVVEPRPADPGQLARVHGSAYLDRLRQLCESGGGHLDEDTYATPNRGMPPSCRPGPDWRPSTP